MLDYICTIDFCSLRGTARLKLVPAPNFLVLMLQTQRASTDETGTGTISLPSPHSSSQEPKVQSKSEKILIGR